MAKNRVAPDRPIRKNDNFFNKSKPNLKSKFKQNKHPNLTHSNKANKNLENNTTDTSVFRPSQSSSNDFLVESTTASSTTEKKPFDKKAWRVRQYSKKYRLDQWEDKRKKAVLRGYYKNIKDHDSIKFDVQKIYNEYNLENGDDEDRIIEENQNNINQAQAPEDTNLKQKKGSKAFKKAHLEFERIKEEKRKNKEAFLKLKAEKAEALKKYKKEKAEKQKKLNRKTKRGQPIMKDRIELLLERIQKSMN